VSHNRRAVLELLLDRGFDPDERTRLSDDDESPETCGMPLWECASTGKYDFAELLLSRGADPNASVYASGTPLYRAYDQRDQRMIELLMRHGGKPDETLAGLYRLKDLAKELLAAGADMEKMLWAATCGGDAEIVRMTLEHIDWARDDLRWFSALEQAIRVKEDGGAYVECFRLLLDRCDPNLRGRPQDKGQFGLTILHSVAGARSHVTVDDRVAFATMLLDAGARLDIRDNLLQKTPLGWARRYGQEELVKLFVERGAET
jgi:ankyrin repeat protein